MPKNKKIRVLDERNVSFQIVNNLLEVYDQNENLVGDTPLPIPVERGMSAEEIYSLAESCGYNIDELLNSVIEESVLENREYDIWLKDDGLIIHSPSTNSWIREPYEGVYAWLEEYFTQNIEESAHEYNEEDCFEQEEEVPLKKNIEVENIHKKEIIKEEMDSEQTVVKEQVHNEKKELESFKGDVMEDEIKNKRLVEKKLLSWEIAYKKCNESEKIVDTTTLCSLSEMVTTLVLEKEEDIFSIDEKDILFELVLKGVVVFDGITALRAGFYQAYLILNGLNENE